MAMQTEQEVKEKKGSTGEMEAQVQMHGDDGRGQDLEENSKIHHKIGTLQQSVLLIVQSFGYCGTQAGDPLSFSPSSLLVPSLSR